HDRFRVFDSACDFFAAIAGVGGSRPKPLLLVIDDLHWSDAPSLLLLQHLGRRLARLPLLVAGAYRSVDAQLSRPLTNFVPALRREGVLELLHLHELSSAECSALIATSAGHAAAPEVSAALHQATEGNPLFLGEMLRHLRSEGRDLSDATIIEEWHVPQGLR